MSTLKSRQEQYPPVHPSGLKSSTVNLRTSPDENELLKQAAEKLARQTGSKENISKTIIEAVKQFNEQEPYSVNSYLYSNLIEIHNRALGYFAGFATGYQALKIGNVSMDILQRISNNDLADIEKIYFDRIEANIERLGQTNEIIKENMRRGTEVPWNQFKQSVENNINNLQRVRQSQPDIADQLDISNYSLDNGVLKFTAEDKEKLRQRYCTVYLDTPAKKEFAKLCEDILKQLDELNIILVRNGMKSVFGYKNVFEIHESAEAQTIFFNKDFLKHIIH